MKLQIKDAGAWRNVASFDAAHFEKIMEASRQLLAALGQPKTVFRVAHNGQALAYCESRDGIAKWRDA